LALRHLSEVSLVYAGLFDQVKEMVRGSPKKASQSPTLIDSLCFWHQRTWFAKVEAGGSLRMEVCVQTRQEQTSERQSLGKTLKAQAVHLFGQYRIVLRALIHPGVPWYAKLVCGLGALYVASPIQLIPNFIPVVGQMDDVLVIALSIKFLKRFIPAAVLEECQHGSRPPAGSEISLDISQK
jgi:uncharacterized membrane protein YkvA (DUF1232 family)